MAARRRQAGGRMEAEPPSPALSLAAALPGDRFPQQRSSASTQKILPGSTSLRSVTARPDVFCFRPLPLPPDRRWSCLSFLQLRAVSRQWCRQDHRMPLSERHSKSSSPAPFARAKAIATRPGRPSGSLCPLRMEVKPYEFSGCPGISRQLRFVRPSDSNGEGGMFQRGE